MEAEAVWSTALAGLPPPRRGKVRDVYDLGETLLLVASDRLSAYDHVLRPGIPGKGKVLTQLSSFWFERLGGIVPHHLLATDPRDFPAAARPHAALLAGRAVLVRKTEVVPFECVARGYLAGSGYREYRSDGRVCGIELPPGLQLASRLPRPIFTPATKAVAGHDENVEFAALAEWERERRAPGGESRHAATRGGPAGDPSGGAEDGRGRGLAQRLRELTLALYDSGAAWAAERDLILADTKFEFGLAADGELLLIDEALTPDSSRYWDVAHWRPGEEPVSFDKQFVRNWLDASGWDHQSPPPELPPDVVDGTRARYVEAFRRLTGREPEL